MTNSRARKSTVRKSYVMPADVTYNNSITLTKIMEFPVISGKVYTFQCVVVITSAATPDALINFDFETGTGTTELWDFDETRPPTAAFGASSSIVSAAWPTRTRFHGIFTCTGTGVFMVQGAQATSDAASTTFHKGSYIQYTES